MKKCKGQAVSEPSNGNYCSRVGHHWEESKEAWPLVADGGGVSQTTSEGHDERSEGTVLDFPNSLLVGPLLDVVCSR